MLRTERLLLQPWTAADLDDAIALWTDPEVMALLGGPLSRAQVEARLASEIERQARRGFQYWRATSGGRFVGCCGLKTTLVDGDEVIELGFHLVREAWGRGYASEAARAAIGFAFDALGAPAIFAGHHPQNRGSRGVLGRLGFVLVGERFYEPTGLMHPWYRLARPSVG